MFTHILLGKVGYVDDLQVVRQKHGSNIRDKIVSDPDRSISEAILRPHWHYDANLFVNHMARLIANVDGLTDEEALAVAKEGFAQIVALRLLGTMGSDTKQIPHIQERGRLYKTVGTDQQIFFSECVNKILKYDVTEQLKH